MSYGGPLIQGIFLLLLNWNAKKLKCVWSSVRALTYWQTIFLSLFSSLACSCYVQKTICQIFKKPIFTFHFVTVKFETIVRQLCWNLPQRLLANFLRGGRYCCLTCLNSSDLLMAICDKGTTRGKVKFRNRHSLALTVTPIFFALVALSKYVSSQVLQLKTISKRYA